MDVISSPAKLAFARSYQTKRVLDDRGKGHRSRIFKAFAELEGIWVPIDVFTALACPTISWIATSRRPSEFLFPTSAVDLYPDVWVYVIPLPRQPRQG